VVVAIGLAALALAMHDAAEAAIRGQHDRALLGRARALAALVEYDEAYEFELAGAVAAGLGTADIYFEVWDPDHRVIARSPSLGAGDLPRPTGAYLDVTLPDGRDGRLVVQRFPAFTEHADEPPTGLVTLVLAEDVVARDGSLATVRRWSWTLGGVTLALVALVTALTVRRGLRPLARLAGAIDAIDPAKPGARLPADARPAELDVVARKLDELLTRLDASVARERRFTADVSHELRTPLAGLRTLLDVTARRERTGDDYRAALTEAGGIVVRLGALVDDLLQLARLDAGHVPVARAPVALRALVDACWAPHADAAAARGLRFDNRVADDVVVDTDRDKLRVVIANLLGNAAEYTEDGGWIAADASDALLDVTDSGPPIPPADLERIFERLWRAEAARTGGVHAGIGLSLARTLCEALGYALTAATLDGGAVRFRITARGRSASPG